jgi:hypothetical protein
MPRNELTKNDIKIKILKLKNQLYLENRSWEEKNLANYYLDEVLFIIEQYAR